MDKSAALAKIAKQIANCKICQEDKIGQAVPGEGNSNADIIFIGEAPGKKEAQTGKPFIGRSGQLLRKLIQEAGIKEEEIFITSPVKYLPAKGTPSKQDISHGMIHTQKQLDVINPKIIILLGSVAAQGVLNQLIPIKKDHGKVIEKNGIKYLVTFHPAAALRFPPLKKFIEEDFSLLKSLIKN